MNEAATPFATTRAVLNANKGITNVIPYEIIRRDLQSVADKLFDVLKGHYGPFSGFAAMDSQDPLKNTKFSKDGIEIMRHVEFASPQEDWMRKTIAFIGTKMESAVGDGTTSAMMFTCAMLKHMLETVDEIRPISYVRLRAAIDCAIEKIKEGENALSKVVEWTDEDGKPNDQGLIDGAIYTIAYHQAYTSSHGDAELAEAIADVFVNSPKELWNAMVYERNVQEKEQRFEVIRSEGQYSMTCDIYTKAMCNKDMRSWFEAENATLAILHDAIRVSDPDTYEKLLALMEGATAEKPFVLVCHKSMDKATYNDLEIKLTKMMNEGKPIGIFWIDPTHPDINDFRSLQLLCDVDIVKAKKNEFILREGTHVIWEHDVLSLDGLYTVPPEYAECKERFQTLDGKHPQYMEYMQGLRKYVDHMNNLDATQVSRDDRNMGNRIYSKLRYEKTAIIRIGGATHDNLAMIDVVDDCMRACCKALKNGVVHSNNRTLYRVVNAILGESYDDVEVWFLKNIKKSLEDIALAALERLHPHGLKVKHAWLFGREGQTERRKRAFIEWWFGHAVNILDYDTDFEWDDPFQEEFPLVDGTKPVTLDPDPTPNYDSIIIVQPANADISMLERFAEVALRYVLTERIIIKGAAYVKEDKK